MSEIENPSGPVTAFDKAAEKFLQHIKAAIDNATNFKFDDAQFDLDQMQSLIGQIPEAERSLGNDFLAYVTAFVMGNRRLHLAESVEDRQAALEHLSTAKSALRRLRSNEAMANSADLVLAALGIEGQILSVQLTLARDRKDTKEVERLSAQSESGLGDMIRSTSPENPVYWFLSGCKSMQEAMPKFAASIGAAGEMNLDLAQQYMRDASASFEIMKSHFSKAGTDVAMAQAATRIGNGFGLIAHSLNSYINVLRAAIIGDVAKTDVEALAAAERNALDGATEIAKATGAAPGFFGGLDMQPYANQLAKLVRNLRALGERSLSPKEISRSASPRAVIYFLVVFVVLLLALPISGLVQKMNFMEVVFLLVISAIISLISAFGFESIRLMPWFDMLARFTPSGSRAEKSKTKPRPTE